MADVKFTKKQLDEAVNKKILSGREYISTSMSLAWIR